MTSAAGLWTRARRLDPWMVDAVAAVILVAISVADEASRRPDPGVVAIVAVAAVGATVAWRRRAPAQTALTAIVFMTVFERTSAYPHASGAAPFAILLDYYMLGRRSQEGNEKLVDVLLPALAIAAIALTPDQSSVVDIAATWSLFVGVPFAAGRALRNRTALNAELRANAERLEREQEERARRAAADERNRIARELHDVVAHSVSVMVIQTAAARRVAGRDRDAARKALVSVESCGREALAEMRRMMGVLRRGDVDLAGAAAPGLAQLHALVERARGSGLPVELRFEGQRRALEPGLDLVAFRVVQEALTNTIKHAGSARARVTVRFQELALELEISDTGHGPAPVDSEPDRVGHGLVGMQERLTLYGGELHTERQRGGGFRVQARIPLVQTVAA